MATFDLKNARRLRSRMRRGGRLGPAGGTDTAVPGGWLLSVLLCVALAAPCPAPALPWVLAGLLSLSGFAWLGRAITRAGPPADAPHLTAWDAALLSFAASFGVQSAARLGLL
ncbi:hypothetical protein [Methylobacterium sp. J-070]|uniref:hypothetical protein n=1 Tax=Methylobacterium sp. J-070 TaxID=2836650 RepID=UPI001FB99DA1|nr:hypothetical protein [Methylobacterium sp. J-070]MCJ2051640.1 hypothetical protein [Methylobacterium sp. J-070]